MTITTKLEEIGDLKHKNMLRVSRRGAGLYLTIPEDLEQALDLRPKDRVEVELRRHYRPPKIGVDEDP